MIHSIHYYSEFGQDQVLSLPKTLQARYVALTQRVVNTGPNIGEPHTKTFGKGLFELRLEDAERKIAEARLKEIKNAHA